VVLGISFRQLTQRICYKILGKISSIVKKPDNRKTFILTILLYLSPFIGLLLDNLLARYFSIGVVLDTFRLTTNFMLLGTGLISGTLLKYVIIPELAHYKAEDNIRGGLVFVTVVTVLVVGLMLPLIFIGLFFPSWLLHILGPGLEIVSGAETLLQVASIGFSLMIITSSFSSVLQFYGIFWGQPTGQIALNGSVLVGIVLFAGSAVTPYDQLKVLSVALGTGVAGMVGVLSFLLLSLWKKELQTPHLTAAPQPIGVFLQKAVKGLLPQIVIVGSELLKPIIVNRTLSHLDSGSIALYSFGFKLLMLSNLPIRAITTTVFPKMSKHHAEGLSKKLLSTLHKATFIILLLTILIAGLLWHESDLVVKTLFGIASLNEKDQRILIELYQTFVFFSPFAALGLLYSEVAFASRQASAVMIYSIINLVLLYIALTYIGSHTEAISVAKAYISTQGLTMSALAIVVYFRLRKLKVQ